MGQDTCKCSHKFVTINLMNLAKKSIKKSDEVNFIIKNGYKDKTGEGLPNFDSDLEENNPDNQYDFESDEEKNTNSKEDKEEEKNRL